MNSKRLYKTAAILMAGMTLAGCASNTQAQTYNYDVNADTLSMKIGSSYKVKATGSDASKVKWTSSDQDVASIDSDGKITAIAEGQTIITAKVKKEAVDVTLTVLGTKNKQKKDIVVVKDGKSSSYDSLKAVKVDISDYKMKLSKTSYEYDGKAKKPTVTITAKDGTKLKLNKDYKVTYQANKNVGSAKAIAKGIKKYTGELEYTFKIVAAKKVETTSPTTSSSTSDTSTNTSSSTSSTTSSSTSSSNSSYTPRRTTSSSSSSATRRSTTSSSSSNKKASSSTRSNTSASTKKSSSTSSSSTKATTPKKNTNNAASSSSSGSTSTSNANSNSETNASNEGSSSESAVTSSASSDTAASASGANVTESTAE